MNDETPEQGQKEKPRLKGIEEFNKEESGSKIFDFQKAKDEREEDDEDIIQPWPPKLKTKFCFKHGEEYFVFDIGPCRKGVHLGFLGFKEVNSPFGKAIVQHPVEEAHVELNTLESFLTKLGFKFPLEPKIEKAALKMKKKLLVFIEKKNEAEKIKRKFKL